LVDAALRRLVRWLLTIGGIFGAVLLLAGCGGRGTAGSTPKPSAALKPTPTLKPSYVNRQFGFSITYPKASLPTSEIAYAAHAMGPPRPAHWTGVYFRNFLATISDADSSAVLNLGFYDRRHVPDGLFLSASRREQRHDISYDLTMAGGVQALLQGVLTPDLMQGKALPVPPTVAIGGLRGYRITLVQSGVDYELYVLYSQRNEYLICLSCVRSRRASDLPMLESVVKSIRQVP
jgi:hypothetical protein